MTAQEYESFKRIGFRTPQDPYREVRVNQGGTTKLKLSSLMNFIRDFLLHFISRLRRKIFQAPGVKPGI